MPEQEKDKVILVGVETEENFAIFDTSMDELRGLTKTADGEIVFILKQKRPQVDRQTILGKGKLAELKQLIDAYEANLVIFNHELTPRQGKILTEELGVRVLDRVQLILDIFAIRARSKEGKLQVSLAQLEYLLPRLTGMGASMSRLGGGIGTRGPGETKLEVDRRHIRNKITQIRNELKEVEQHRERTREQRKNKRVYQIGLIGYTNAGKSTIMNILTTANTYEQDQLFATLDPLTKKWRLPEGFEMTITDTVGFIQDLPTQLIDAFQSTLEESKSMDFLLHVVDAHAKDRLLHEKTVFDLMQQLEIIDIPVLTVYNKADLMKEEDFVPTLFPNVCISAKSSKGKEALIQAIKQQLMEQFEPYMVELADNQASEIYKYKRETIVTSQNYDESKRKYIICGFSPK
ncbi:GTPase HflX [Enterococcus cecorum]|uniref:GTPase HflX n=1 Tax=Enterococcus cecorum TaxID=44008 RepID=A0A366SHT7_9ENTE|nr:GTPase HflX [Enterococcus cecorum]MCJ0601514.1 GTPase HflX [Enterococcus cecorum]RBR29596.1 GTP-binding protein HflX [Enterococcus cecorum]